MQTCQVTSAASQVHDWLVYRYGDILGSVGHRVKTHKITTTTGKGRGDLEVKDSGVDFAETFDHEDFYTA